MSTVKTMHKIFSQEQQDRVNAYMRSNGHAPVITEGDRDRIEAIHAAARSRSKNTFGLGESDSE